MLLILCENQTVLCCNTKSNFMAFPKYVFEEFAYFKFFALKAIINKTHSLLCTFFLLFSLGYTSHVSAQPPMPFWTAVFLLALNMSTIY